MADGKIGQPAPTTANLAGAIDPNGKIQGISVDNSGNLKISGTITTSNPSVGTNGAAIPTSSTQAGGSDGTNLRPIKVASDGTVAVSAASLPLPSGAATEATLSTLNGKVTAVNTGAVVVSSSALPAGAATEATLSTLNGKVTAVNTGAVVLAAGSAIAGKFGIDQTTPGTTNAVSVTNFPATQPVSGTVTVTQATGSNLHVAVDSMPTTTITGTVAATQSGTWNITNVSGTVSLPTGAATETTLSSLNAKVTAVNTGAVVLAAGAATIGALTANQTVNVSQINGVTPLMGAGNTGTGALRTTRASGGTGTLTNVVSSSSNVTLLASNALRLSASFFNDSTQLCYLKFGATATSSSYTVQMPSLSYYELPGPHIYSGIIDGIWASANGNMRVTEVS